MTINVAISWEICRRMDHLDTIKKRRTNAKRANYTILRWPDEATKCPITIGNVSSYADFFITWLNYFPGIHFVGSRCISNNFGIPKSAGPFLSIWLLGVIGIDPYVLRFPGDTFADLS